MSAPYFSVVIPTYKRLPMLLRVLDALEEQHGAPDLEVIVIDDGSGDNTSDVMSARRANHYTLTFRTQPNAGPGRARNHGVSLAAGRYILFIGDDTVPEPRFLAEHARVHRDANDDPLVACLGYTGWPPGERVTAFMDYINDYGLQFGYKLIRDGEIVPFNFFYTSNISIDRQLLGDEPFDTTFPAAAWEDIELAFRLDALGLKIRYNANADHPPLPPDDRRFVRAAAIHRRPFRRDLLPQASGAGRLSRRSRTGDAHARQRAAPGTSAPPRAPRRTIPCAGDKPRVRNADARTLPARVAGWARVQRPTPEARPAAVGPRKRRS